VTNIIGGGAFSAQDKIIQHNGCGTVNIQDVSLFYDSFTSWQMPGVS
jgi:hypothetical protein